MNSFLKLKNSQQIFIKKFNPIILSVCSVIEDNRTLKPKISLSNIKKKEKSFQLLYAPYKNKIAQKHITKRNYDYTLKFKSKIINSNYINKDFFLQIKKFNNVESNIILLKSISVSYLIFTQLNEF